MARQRSLSRGIVAVAIISFVLVASSAASGYGGVDNDESRQQYRISSRFTSALDRVVGGSDVVDGPSASSPSSIRAAVSEEEDEEDSVATEDGITRRGSSSSRQRRELSWWSLVIQALHPPCPPPSSSHHPPHCQHHSSHSSSSGSSSSSGGSGGGSGSGGGGGGGGSSSGGGGGSGSGSGGWDTDGWGTDGHSKSSSLMHPGSLAFWMLLAAAAAMAIAIAAMIIGSRRRNKGEYHPLNGVLKKRMAMFGGIMPSCCEGREMCGAQEQVVVEENELAGGLNGSNGNQYRQMV